MLNDTFGYIKYLLDVEYAEENMHITGDYDMGFGRKYTWNN